MSTAPFVDSRRIGDALVTVISEETVRVPLAWAVDAPEEEWRAALPGIPADGKERFGQNVIHLALGDASILIDTGFDAPESAWGQHHAELFNPERTPGTEAGLASIGVRPDDITHVLITHGHWDHMVGATAERNEEFVLRYPRARHLLGRADLEADPDPAMTARLAVLQRSGLLELIEGDVEVVPGVTMLHTPGESAGHYIVRVVSQGEYFYALGDLFHHRSEVQHLDWMGPERDRDAMRRSRERVLPEIAACRATVVFTHMPFPPWGAIIATAHGYRWDPG